MILYWIIFILFSVAAFSNWKKTVIMWASIRFLFNEGVCLKYTSPAVSFVLAFDVLLILIYLVRKNKIKGLTSSAFEFKSIFIFYLISYLCSLVFSILPFNEALTGTIKYFISSFGVLFILQKALNNRSDITLFVQTCVIVVICITGLGIYESIFKSNPIQEYIYYNTSPDLLAGKTYFIPAAERISGELQGRYGMVRAFSFFGIHIQFGLVCVYFLYLFTFLLVNKYNFIQRKQYICSIILLLIGVLISNSKTPIVGALCFCFSFFSLHQIVKIKYIAGITIIAILIFTYMPNYLNNFFALFDKKLASEGGGSDLDLRILQYKVGLSFFLDNPLFGNGIQSIEKALRGINSDIYGAESSWIKILGERGIIGLISYLSMFFTLYKLLVKKTSKQLALGFILCILAMDTATGENNIYNYGIILLVILRINYLRKIYFKKKILAQSNTIIKKEKLTSN